MKFSSSLSKIFFSFVFLFTAIWASSTINAQKSTYTDGLFGEYTVDIRPDGEKILEFKTVTPRVAELIGKDFENRVMKYIIANVYEDASQSYVYGTQGMQMYFEEMANAIGSILNKCNPTTVIFDGVTYRHIPEEKIFLIEGSDDSQFATAFEWITESIVCHYHDDFKQVDPEAQAEIDQTFEEIMKNAKRIAAEKSRALGGVSKYDYDTFVENARAGAFQDYYRHLAEQALQRRGIVCDYSEEYNRKLFTEIVRISNRIGNNELSGSGYLFKLIIRGNVKLLSACMFKGTGLIEVDASESNLSFMIFSCLSDYLERFASPATKPIAVYSCSAIENELNCEYSDRLSSLCEERKKSGNKSTMASAKFSSGVKSTVSELAELIKNEISGYQSVVGLPSDDSKMRSIESFDDSINRCIASCNIL